MATEVDEDFLAETRREMLEAGYDEDFVEEQIDWMREGYGDGD
jgi:hypothetical protein